MAFTFKSVKWRKKRKRSASNTKLTYEMTSLQAFQQKKKKKNIITHPNFRFAERALCVLQSVQTATNFTAARYRRRSDHRHRPPQHIIASG
jgi:hypothetical protein